LSIVIINILIAIIAIVAKGIFVNNEYISWWCQAVLWIDGILVVLLTFHFFNTFYWIASLEYHGDKFGFKGINRIKQLYALKVEIEQLEIKIRVLKKYQTKLLTIGEQLELYKDELMQTIEQYQQMAKRNRGGYFTLQIIIIACSLLVGSLTSGLTNLVSIFGSHWIAPALSVTVSFLTAMVTLFRPREKGYNLQHTADAIEYEINCANKRIYGYEELDENKVYTKLSQEVEKLKDDQKKRQQLLEQSSEVKHATE
ncbi:MAG TPA: SLATT domain-containing protein, partial [Methylomirabilota bacterium]|nr:SLATT domain-containing protein [Methylomirabilota bacterium]